MNLVQLNEVYISQLVESKNESQNKKAVLKSVEGPFAEVNEQNRNGRRYSRKLWEKVINSDYVKEMLPNRTLFGEADHPADRAEISLPNVSHVVTSLKMMPDGVIYGKADILDTPAGRILNTLIEYGAKLGVSSRGMGTISEGDGNWVDEENYVFITFDFVPMPSVRRARPNVHESESIDYKYQSITESILQQIQQSGRAELEIIENVVNQMDEKIKNGVQHILLERKNIPQDSTLLSEVEHLKTSNEDFRTTLERMKEEKRTLQEHIVTLEQSLTRVTESSKGKQKEMDQERESFQESFRRLKNEITQLHVENEQYKAVQNDFSAMQKRLHETLSMVSSNDPEVKELKSMVESYSSVIDKQKVTLNEITTRYNQLGEQTEKYVHRNKELCTIVAEIVSLYSRIPVQTIQEGLKPQFSLADVYRVAKFYKNDKAEIKAPINERSVTPQKLNKMSILSESKEPATPVESTVQLESLIKRVRGGNSVI